MRVALVMAFMTASLCLAGNRANADWIIYQEDFTGFNDGDGYDPADAGFGNERESFSNQEGRTRIVDWGGERGGVLVLDDYYGTITSSLNEAILTDNLLGYTDVTLPFDYYDSCAEAHGIGASPFVGPTIAEGVSVSSDGTNGSPLINLSQADFTWESYRASISDLVAAVPALDLSGTFQIKFQQYDNYFHGFDGCKFDNVSESAQQPHLPEPEAVTLFGLGLLCLGMSCVRRRTMG